MDTIFAIMTEEKANQRETVKIGMDKLRKYFPRGTTPKQMEDTIHPTVWSVNCRENETVTADKSSFLGG